MKLKTVLVNLGAFATVFIAATKALEYFDKKNKLRNN